MRSRSASNQEEARCRRSDPAVCSGVMSVIRIDVSVAVAAAGEVVAPAVRSLLPKIDASDNAQAALVERK
jgi:hypothetical protein